ncbi:hypothetical protein [Bradyrhizobium sp. CCGUVB23]|uniref:hypothetical protein n=1 Tax=Bradyrhizobium sp. CCGUVB23 TaxID=2949630 RepID=UPI0020B3E891|nr:hypothetical protein [Bradyrhizobium sp. CCGUVB23]MCP3466273.1 hypothetical protein [Bradyrhizobium sp. CCGUVB23]
MTKKRTTTYGLLATAAGAAIPFMMQVGPDDAIANLCKWPKKLTPSLTESCSRGLSSEYLYVVAAGLVFLGLVWLTAPLRTHGTKSQKMIVGISLLITSIALGVWALSILAAGDRSSARRGPFELGAHIYTESRLVKAESGRDTGLHENTFYLVVANSSDDGSTIRKVQVEIRGYEAPVASEIKDTETSEIDIKHGNAAFFVLGRIVSSSIMGVAVGSVTIEDRYLEMFEHNVQRGMLRFDVGTRGNKYRFALALETDRPSIWNLIAVISADDRRSVPIDLMIDPQEKKRPMKYKDARL